MSDFKIIQFRPALPGSHGAFSSWLDEVGSCCDAVRVFLTGNIWRRKEDTIFPYIIEKWEGNIPIFKPGPDGLGEFNPIWFDEWENICRGLKLWNKSLIMTIVDDCIQGINPTDPEHSFKLSWCWWRALWGINYFYEGEKIRPHLLRFLDKVIPLAKSIGVDLWVETINELAFPVPDNPEGDNRYQFHTWLVQQLNERYEIPKERLMLSCGGNWKVFSNQVQYFSFHCVATPGMYGAALHEARDFPRERIIVSGDGAHGSGQMGKFGYQLMTVEDAEWIARRMIEDGIRWYEYGDQSSDDNINCWLEPPKTMKKIFNSIPPEPPQPPTPPIPPKPPKPEPKPKEMNRLQQAWHWLWGKNSFFQKHPKWARFLIGLIIGFILGLTLFSCSRLPRNEDVYLAESRLIQIVSPKCPCQLLYFENGMIVEMNLETRYAIGEVYKIYKVNLPAPKWVIRKSGIIK